MHCAGAELPLEAHPHRHSISALRFVIEGNSGLHTIVNGERCPMEANDLVLTPAWTWHDHHNDDARDGIWLDVLDGPVVSAFNQTFMEPYGADRQPAGVRLASPENVLPPPSAGARSGRPSSRPSPRNTRRVMPVSRSR